MEFTFYTEANAKAMRTLVRTVRKTVRKKQDRFTRIFGIAVIVLALLLVIPLDGRPFVLNTSAVITLIAAAVVAIVMVFQDRMNGYIARKRLMPGAANNTAVFHEDSFTSSCEVGTTEWHYDKVLVVAETNDYFVFLYSKMHGQVYEKASMTGGTTDEFRTFIEEKTGRKVQKI